MDLIYKSYSNMSINDYFRLRALIDELQDADSDELSLNLIAFLCGVDVDEVMKCKMFEIARLTNEIQWVLKPIKPGKIPFYLKLNGKMYDIRLDMRKCTTQQYIDFTQYSRDREHFYKECLSCIIIPQGMEYNDGYDATEVAKIIGDNVSIQTAEDIYKAFALASKMLYVRSLKSLMQKILKSLKKTKKEGMTVKRVKEMRTVVNLKEQITFLSGLGL